jgi:hypothetical protein
VAFELSAERLVEEAHQRTGLEDLGGDTYRDGLDRLVEGIQTEARLNPLGEAMTPELLTSYLINRLEVTDWHARHPDMAAADVTPPIVMIGMGRTGSTILHDLFGQDPANRIPLTWEVDRPCPPPETATYDHDPRIDEVQAQVEGMDQLHPEFKTMHPTGARLGQECIRITGGEFASLIFLSQFRLPSYSDWLTNEADLRPAYRYHRRFLQLLQWHHPGDRWVLKSGGHLWALPALVAEYPGAWMLQTHRDPLQIIPSLSSLFATVHSIATDDVSIAQVAGDWTDGILDALDRSVTARETGLVNGDRVIDIQYEAFVADPIGTVRTIYDRWDLELTEGAEGRMRAFLAQNTQNRHGPHRYSFADTGLVAGEIRERARRYQEYFDVRSQPIA